MIFDPRFIYICLWVVEIVAYILLGGVFDSFNLQTWVIVAINIFAFLVGAQLIEANLKLKGIKEIKFVKRVEDFFRDDLSDSFINTLLWILPIALILVFYRLLLITDVSGMELNPPECLRLKVVIDMISNRELSWILKTFTAGIAVCIFLLLRAKGLSNKQFFLIILLGILFSLATTGRLLLLMFFCAMMYLVYILRGWSIKGLLLTLVTFVFMFLLIALVFKKESADWASGKNINPCTNTNKIPERILKRNKFDLNVIYGRVVWNAQNYLLGSLAAFNHYVQTGEPKIEEGAFLPNSFRNVLNLFGAKFDKRPPLNPFVLTPLQTNTYTSMFPVYHDFGKIGILIWFLLLGILHQVLYKLSQLRDSNIFKYIYAISLYPLCMTIFEEAHISSPGFWLVFLIIPIILQISNYFWIKAFGKLN